MKIVAEGLETPEEIQKVLELEVDLLQGSIWHVRNQFLEISMKMH